MVSNHLRLIYETNWNTDSICDNSKPVFFSKDCGGKLFAVRAFSMARDIRFERMEGNALNGLANRRLQPLGQSRKCPSVVRFIERRAGL